MTEKIDFKRTLDAYTAPKGRFRTVDVPDLRYLAIDAHGDPNGSPSFTTAIETLYPVAYRMKFASKRELDRDYVVPPLEGLWRAENLDAFTVTRDKSRWEWTLLLMVPRWLGEEHVEAAVAQARERDEPPVRLDDLRLLSLSEGRCIQTLHVGPFDDEADVLARMHGEYIPDHGLRMTGEHHEIYLSDLRRVAPARQRTILRQPVVAA